MKQDITIVVATAQNLGIGKNNELLWHLPADLKHFKSLTTGKPIIMGRKTFESIGRALPNRLNIVISRQEISLPEGVLHAKSIEEALALTVDAPEVCIIGGGNIYEQTLPIANKIELTTVHANFEADVYFPKIDEKLWKLVKKADFEADEKNPYSYSFSTLLRK